MYIVYVLCTCIIHTVPMYIHAAAFLTQTVNLDDTTVKFEIWDTAGQERYHSLAPMYYRGAQAAIVVYDITNMVSGCITFIAIVYGVNTVCVCVHISVQP